MSDWNILPKHVISPASSRARVMTRSDFEMTIDVGSDLSNYVGLCTLCRLRATQTLLLQSDTHGSEFTAAAPLREL